MGGKNGAGQELSRKKWGGSGNTTKQKTNRTGKNGAGQELSRVKIESIFGGQQKKNVRTIKNGAGQELSRVKIKSIFGGQQHLFVFGFTHYFMFYVAFYLGAGQTQINPKTNKKVRNK